MQLREQLGFGAYWNNCGWRNESGCGRCINSITELGSYQKLVLDNFFGVSGPAKMPAEVVNRINLACNDVLTQADIKKRMLDLGITISTGTSASFTTYVREQVEVLAPAVKGAGVKL